MRVINHFGDTRLADASTEYHEPKQFRARLRAPKDEYWLGCVIDEVEKRKSKSNGRPYLRVTFTNCPLFLTLSGIQASWHDKIREQNNKVPCPLELFIVQGWRVNLDVRWRMSKSGPYEGQVFPHIGLDLYALNGVDRRG